jgi:hypothetical protein
MPEFIGDQRENGKFGWNDDAGMGVEKHPEQCGSRAGPAQDKEHWQE